MPDLVQENLKERKKKLAGWLSPVRDTFRGLGAVLYKEAIHVRRDSMALLFALIIPIVEMIILGFGIDTNVRQIKTVAYDEDGRRESRELIERLRNSDMFRLVGYVYSDRELNEAIVSGRARVGVKIPVDYSDHLLDGTTAQVLVLIDGSDSSVAGQALNVSTAIGLDESLRRVLASRQSFPVEVRPKILFNPDSRSPNFFLPGLTAVLLLSVTTFLTAFSIVREKEKGTLEQLFVTPVRPMGLLLGKILPYLAIGFLELCAILLMMRFAFRVPIHGHTLLLIVLSLPYLFVSLSIGTLISSKAHSQSEAMQLAFMIMLPTIFFSGYVFPRETMPLPFYLLSFLVPATYFINIARGIILRGAGLRHLWVDGLILLVMGIGLLLLAAKGFQKKVIENL
jgi:ABC-2 type transport system permease protein